MDIFELNPEDTQRSFALHEESIIIDGCQSSEFTNRYFRTVRDAGVTATIVTVAWNHTLHEAVKRISEWRSNIRRNEKVALFVDSVASIQKAKKENRVAYLFGFQNTLPLEGDTDLLDMYRDLGVRIIQLTYNEQNLVGCGCNERADCGLTKFGIQVIKRMNRLGILVDLSHAGELTAAQAIELAEFPVFSHSNAKSLCDNLRNIKDEQIEAISKKGGMIGVNAYPAFVKRTRTEIGERPSLMDFLDHIDYMVKIAGIDHVGISLDLIENRSEEEFALLASNPEMWGLPDPQGIYKYPEGIEGIDKMGNITRGLVSRGYSDNEIKKILGENWLKMISRAGKEIT